MYTDYFGLTEKPFSIAPDPGFLYMSESHREALAHLLYGLQTDGGFVLLTGEVGTGKTTICKSLFTRIPPEIDLAFVLNPKISVIELLQTICDELHIDNPDSASTKMLVDAINQHLLQTNAQGRKTVLLIDEAQNLSIDVLEQLRLLTNLETDKRKLLQIILLGQPELRDMINRPQLRQLAQRVTARYHLGPLNKQDIRGYIAHRIQVAGGHKNYFTPQAIRVIHKRSLGIPRLINLICDRALLGAYTKQQPQVTPAIIRQACAEIFDRTGRKQSLPWILATLICFIIISGLSYKLLTPTAAKIPLTANSSTTEPEKYPITTAPDIPETQASQTGVPEVMIWPVDFAFGNTRENAFTELADRWGLNYRNATLTPCDFARESGLRCYDRQEDLASLVALDRPAILTLYDDQGKEFFVVLTSIEGDLAEFHANGEIRTLNISALQNRWFGEYRILWTPPKSYSGIVYPGHEDPLNLWLGATLSATGNYSEQQQTSVLAGTLLGALKRFQFAKGLTPDGVLGPKTIIHLNQLAEVSGPHLSKIEVN